MDRETVLVGIDAGTTKVTTLIGEVSRGGDVNIIGYGIAPSVGMKKGMVANIDQTVNSIAASLEKAERLSGYKISSAFVAVGGSHIRDDTGAVVAGAPRSPARSAVNDSHGNIPCPDCGHRPSSHRSPAPMRTGCGPPRPAW